MIIVKLIVFICCINNFSAGTTDYCEICLDHTLCKYKMPGPSHTCKSYDKSALLRSQDMIDLVNRINERRNFVAMGYSEFLPHAADMKKIHWSTDLATFAQRWADQCDQSVRPDKQDQCRDLENIKVGQNIASVMGPTTGLGVKGFVEMWFIQIIDYTGSVTYYNETRDYKTSYFTQLIWADAEFIGCGKAKFYVEEKNAVVERLVCNIAPKGNIHGRPVYSIGYPGTQCKNKMIPDEKFKGLCVYEDTKSPKKLTNQRRPMNSLLRILNLSNDPVTHEIDPIRNGLRQTNINSNSSNEQRNQKTRHILSNKTYTAVKRIPQLRKQMIRKNYINFSGTENDHYHDRGHSHLYHGHEPPRYNYDFTTPFYTNQDFRRYDYTTESINLYSTNNYRKYYQNVQCTRRMRPEQNNCVSNQCTSDPPECCSQTPICPSTCTEMLCTKPVEECTTCPTPFIPPLADPCTCTKQTCPPLSTNCNYDTNCQSCIPCPTNTHCLTTICPEMRKKNNDFNYYRKTGPFQYYDMIPNVVVRSGNYKIPQESTSQKGLSYLDNSEDKKSNKKIFEGKDSDQRQTGATDYSKYNLQEHDYIYHSFDSSLKKKRNLEDQVTLERFWQNENSNYNRQSQLRNIKYTTLSNKKNRKTRKYSELVKWSLSTEPITLKLSDYEYQPEHVTEKYLSFDELMHLRKITNEYSHYDLRRKGKTTAKGATTKAAAAKQSGNATTKAATKATKKAAEDKTHATEAKSTTKATTKTTKATSKTTEYTANTPFERKKHCTRKLTCTWTAFTANSNQNGPNFIGPEMGSRTPPGYVDGCTRTSTCTRDYMDRNKISTIPDDSSSEPTPEDEDYCERRSLNVQRRNSDEKKSNGLVLRYLDYTDLPVMAGMEAGGSRRNDPILDRYINNVSSVSKTHVCICNESHARKKRQETKFLRDKEDNASKKSSYADVKYWILNKILHSNQANPYHTEQCPCSGSISCSHFGFLILYICFKEICVVFRCITNNVI